MCLLLAFVGVLGNAFAVDSPGSAPLPAPESHPKYLYLIPKPIEGKVAVGKISRAANYTYQVGSTLVEAGIPLLAGQPVVAAGVAVAAMARYPIYVPLWNAIDLGIRQKRYNSRLMSELRGVPHVRRAFLLSGGDYEFYRLSPQARNLRNLVVLETDEPLPDTILKGLADPRWNPNWAKPIPVTDSHRSMLNFTLVVDGKRQKTRWSVSLHDIANQGRVPEATLAEWAEAIRASDAKVPSFILRELHLRKSPPIDRIHLDATFTDPSAGKLDLHTVAVGREVKALMGLTLPSRVAQLFGGGKGRMPLRRRELASSAACPQDYEALAGAPSAAAAKARY